MPRNVFKDALNFTELGIVPLYVKMINGVSET
jgi:hypothetical protein